MTADKQKEFDNLYKQYYDYLYKYELNDTPNYKKMPTFARKDSFEDQIKEEALSIKVSEGY